MAKSELYQEYLRVIGKLKDVYKLHVDVDHEDIHTFYIDKKPLFKLLFGTFTSDPDPSIVVSFHVSLLHPEAITWFINIYRTHPGILIHDSYIEDSNGESYLGEDALALQEVYQTQDILAEYLENSSREEMEDFATAPVFGRERDTTKSFDSRDEKTEAIIEFERLRKPSNDDQVH